MGKINIRALILVLMLLVTVVLSAQNLIKNASGEVVPYLGTRWEARTVACTADTVWTKITLPANTFELLVNPTAGLKISADSLYYAANPYEVALVDTTLWTPLPVHNMTEIWIRRASAGTAATLKVIFRKW
jgi:hypothetical protein